MYKCTRVINYTYIHVSIRVIFNTGTRILKYTSTHIEVHGLKDTSIYFNIWLHRISFSIFPFLFFYFVAFIKNVYLDIFQELLSAPLTELVCNPRKNWRPICKYLYTK